MYIQVPTNEMCVCNLKTMVYYDVIVLYYTARRDVVCGY